MSDLQTARALAAAHAPYLARLMARRPDLVAALDAEGPQAVFERACADADAVAADPPAMDEAMRVLRRAKDGLHLSAALADLAGDWPLERVTQALSRFADAATRASLALAWRAVVARGDLWGDAPVGVTILALGKMGAGELNYSSDIDVSIFYDADALPLAPQRSAAQTAQRLVAPFVRALEEVTADGYVFRTDLRLRPDPGATPPAVSIASAEIYYQNLGQNWERAAFIKARYAAGDVRLADEFLRMVSTFIWRRHLDYAAIADIQSIKRQILSVHKSAELSAAIFDVKLGRGGIRDIELFAQTQQLILGGRHRALRDPTTCGALRALTEYGALNEAQCATLIEAYRFYRGVEHRIQMLQDEQTQRVPADPETRAHLAALCGFDDLAAFDDALIARRALVAEIDRSLFGRGESLADPLGSLVFTGVEDNLETLVTLAQLGFSDPAMVSQTIRGWHHGRVRAMRSARARELLTDLTPRLLRALAETGEPDQAFLRFASFFAGLAAGVQVLSLLTAQPALLGSLARAFGLAPRLAETLARRPALIDAMIEPDFVAPLAEDAPAARATALRRRLEDQGFEAALNEARRFHREESLRIGMQVLEGRANAAEAGAAYADLAEACVAALSAAALAETERRFGAQPGAFVVAALGKFGGRELAEGSDLDVIVIYDAPEATDFYARFTQRLVSALSAPTEEGALYDIDMQLRPSGSAGPLAVRFSSFERYYAEDAWTWELLALTRLRVVAGDADLAARVVAVRDGAVARPRDGAKMKADIAEMRARMDRERPPANAWDMKLAAGGFVDIEFIAQGLQLLGRAALSANTGEALAALAARGALPEEDAHRLRASWTLFSDLQQVLRICVDGAFEPATAPQTLRQRLAAIAAAPDFTNLEAELRARRGQIRALFGALF